MNSMERAESPSTSGTWIVTFNIPVRALQVCLFRVLIGFTLVWAALMTLKVPNESLNSSMVAPVAPAQNSSIPAADSTRVLSEHVLRELITSRINNSTFVNNSEVILRPPKSPKTLLEEKQRKTILRIFNESCPVDYLGLTPYLSAMCSKSPDLQSLCSNLTCRNLIKGENKELYKQARDLMDKYGYKRESDNYFIDITKNCSQFLELRGYNKKMALTEDADFPLAYNLIVHRNAEMIERLVYSVYRSHNQICIHMDANSKPEFKEALEGVAKCLSPNVFIASKLEPIVYGGYSRLQADLNCMIEHIGRGTPWKYVLNSAGEAYPLRTQREIVNILKIYNGLNDIEGIYGRRLDPRRYLYKNEYRELKGTVVKTGKVNPPIPHDIDIVKGSVYAALSREFVEFMVKDRRARDFLRWSETTYSPDEFYWSSLHHRFANPHIKAPGSIKVYPSQDYFTAVYANWGAPQCTGKYVHYICVFGVGDLPFLTTRHELFANKFYADFEPLALDCMRAWLNHREFCPVELNYDFYHEVAHRDDIV